MNSRFGACGTTYALIGLTFLAATTTAAAADDGPPVSVTLWFVQFDPSLDPGLLPLDMRAVHASHPDVAPIQDGRIQTIGLARQMKAGELSIGANGHRLAMRDGALVSTAENAGAKAAPWQILSAPRLALAIGQQGVVSVGRPVSYMVRREDGCLAVETDASAVEGAEVSLTAKWAKGDEVRFEDIRLKLTRVAQRQPLEGVPFDVGRPVLDTRETALGLTIPAENVGIIPLPLGEGEAPILVFLTATSGKAADARER